MCLIHSLSVRNCNLNYYLIISKYFQAPKKKGQGGKKQNDGGILAYRQVSLEEAQQNAQTNGKIVIFRNLIANLLR